MSADLALAAQDPPLSTGPATARVSFKATRSTTLAGQPRPGKTVRGQRSETYLTAILIKAWNAYRSGEEVGVLRFRPGGAHPEKFPEPE